MVKSPFSKVSVAAALRLTAAFGFQMTDLTSRWVMELTKSGTESALSCSLENSYKTKARDDRQPDCSYSHSNTARMSPALTTQAPAPQETTKPKSSHPTPTLFAHAVLRTTPTNYQPMIAFYMRLLNATIVHTSPVITFLRYDEEHHRIAILQTPDTQPKPDGLIHTGLDHLAFTYTTLTELAQTYSALKEPGEDEVAAPALRPVWCVNHGPTTSM